MAYFRLAVDGGVALLTLDQPDASVNTVSPSWVSAMTSAFQDLAADPAVTGVIITSAKPGFMAGADLEFILDHTSGWTTREAFAFSQAATRLHRLIETCGKPVVAALNGFALGGGYELALACHWRVAADSPAVSVGLPEVNVGLLPGSGGTQRLARLLGADKALDILLTGRSHDAEEALRHGLVDALAPPERLIEDARAWLETGREATRPWDVKGYRPREYHGLLDNAYAQRITARVASLSARYGSLYPAPLAILTCVYEGLQAPIEAGLRIESRHFARLIADPTARNIIRTTFVNRNRARKGAAAAPTPPLARIGVLGAGMMGAGIALVAAEAGLEVTLLDTTLALAEAGRAYSERVLSRRVDQGRLAREAADQALARIRPGVDFADLAGCELVIEAVFEDKAVKAEVLRRAEAVLGPKAVLASNTSTLPIGELAAGLARPDRFVGVHFFSPVERMDLVEIIRGARTGDDALARARDLVRRLRKTPIVVGDGRGFYTSRVFQTFIHEGAAMLGEGVAPALIENAARRVGMPIGPLALLDEVTLDLPLRIIDQALADGDDGYVVPCGEAVMRRMKDGCGRSGRKGGGGFYDYEADGTKRLWRGLEAEFPPAARQPDVEELGRRLLYVQALETARCLDDGVLSTPADADLGAVLGWGFPTWAGGPLSLVDTVGAARFVAACDDLARRQGPRFAPTDRLRRMAEAGEAFHP